MSWTICECTHIAQDHAANDGECYRCHCKHYTGHEDGAPTQREMKLITANALMEFWAYVAKQFPKAEFGDLSPLATIRLEEAALEAVKEWWNNNAKDQI